MWALEFFFFFFWLIGFYLYPVKNLLLSIGNRAGSGKRYLPVSIMLGAF